MLIIFSYKIANIDAVQLLISGCSHHRVVRNLKRKDLDAEHTNTCFYCGGMLLDACTNSGDVTMCDSIVHILPARR